MFSLKFKLEVYSNTQNFVSKEVSVYTYIVAVLLISTYMYSSSLVTYLTYSNSLYLLG